MSGENLEEREKYPGEVIFFISLNYGVYCVYTLSMSNKAIMNNKKK